MKKGFILLSMVTVLMLSGCASMETKFEKALLEQSGINENADYILYEEYRDAGKLDDEGQYIAENSTEDALNTQEREDGQRPNLIWYFLYQNRIRKRDAFQTSVFYCRQGRRILRSDL